MIVSKFSIDDTWEPITLKLNIYTNINQIHHASVVTIFHMMATHILPVEA